MNWESHFDYRMFVHQTNNDNGVSVVIVDDRAPRVGTDIIDDVDAQLVATIANKIANCPFVRRVILSNFEFNTQWLDNIDDPKNCIYFVDVWSGDGYDAELRGDKIRNHLFDVGVCRQNIALFTKALDDELSQYFGKDHGHTQISKNITRENQLAGGTKLWDYIADDAMKFVGDRCDDPYFKASAIWNQTAQMLDRWPPSGLARLFGDPPKHDVSPYWINNGADANNAETLKLGHQQISLIINSETVILSHIAIYCGLKGITIGRGSVRLFCELSGISGDILDKNNIQLQLFKKRQPGDDAQALFAIWQIVSTKPQQPWVFNVMNISKTELTLSGVTCFNSESDAFEAVTILSKSPDQRMKDEPERIGPGVGVKAVSKLRAYSNKLELYNVEKQLNLLIVFDLQGKLRDSK